MESRICSVASASGLGFKSIIALIAPLIIALLSIACASHVPPPPLNPHAEAIAHFGIGLGPERMGPDLQMLGALGTHLTLRVPVHSYTEARDVLDSVRPYSTLSVLLLIEKPDLDLVTAVLPAMVDAWPGRLAGIELGNELDLYGLTPQQFGAFVLAGYQQLRRHYDGPIISGGIFSVQDDSLDYVRHASVNWPADIVLGIHPYEALDDDVLAKLQAFHRQIAATEYGMPSRNAAEDQAQDAYLRSQTAMLTRLGAAWALIYQLVSGACGDLSNLANFGLLDCHNSPKPSMELLR